ncbi:amidohydrolase family protein [Nubsella zeaxanthinifaciens]|jgi:imidazolonepropionase-like amidohydrolase|uniref:amidohydrolase family protein n=1 Tax=Nubsella zeaxanthinifaciens TaxID=392412 RepID=UPI001F2798A3|nr:amidohydrolase family protein [Nubsella zeaxanthinifaciens]
MQKKEDITMNKKILTLFVALAASMSAFAQANISPAKAQAKKVILLGGVVHTGNGTVINNGYVVFEKGKITGVGDATTVKFATNDAELVNINGKHVYPGFIAPVNTVGLVEFESVKATLDFQEIGNLNPHIRSLVAYNTDSKIPATLRSNGVLMAQIRPSGGSISGSSSVVQLDAWNWEDAAVKTDDGMHVNWPVTPRFRGFGGRPGFSAESFAERTQAAIAELTAFFEEAKAYNEGPKPAETNTRMAAMAKLFKGEQKLYISANTQKDIVAAVNFAKKFNLTPVIIGGSEAYLITDFLKQNNVAVIVNQPHSLPTNIDDDVNMPYKNAAILYNAGVTVAISIENFWQQRNLPFMAGTVATWGLDKEKALQTITLNTAKILGIEKTAGSLEVGKDATLFISTGDALDMRTNKIEKAFIQGRDINLDNLHKQLDKKFSDKYGIK